MRHTRKVMPPLHARVQHVNSGHLDASGIRRTTIHLFPLRQVLDSLQCACQQPLGSRRVIERLHAEEYVVFLRKHRWVSSVWFIQAQPSGVASGKHVQQAWQHGPATSHDVKDKQELPPISKIKRAMNVDSSSRHRPRTTDGTK